MKAPLDGIEGIGTSTMSCCKLHCTHRCCLFGLGNLTRDPHFCQLFGRIILFGNTLFFLPKIHCSISEPEYELYFCFLRNGFPPYPTSIQLFKYMLYIVVQDNKSKKTKGILIWELSNVGSNQVFYT